MIFREVVPAPNLIMGAKAVFGPLSSHLLCFGGRGNPGDERYFQLPRGVANRAMSAPFILAIGGGRNVRDGLAGKVLNLARSSLVYGRTTELAEPSEAQRLQQWPVASVMHEVWTIEGHPHLVADLGMADRSVLAAAMDGVVRYDDKIVALWEKLADWHLTPDALPLPVNMASPTKPTLVRGSVPKLEGGSSSEEGKRIWEYQLKIERSSRMSRLAKQLNFEEYGIFKCESCDFSNLDSGMFDSHHLTPLAIGVRTTLPQHFAVLCPTCHRHSHRGEKLDPKPLDQLKAWVVAGRP